MKGDATRLALALFVLVVACAVEEAVPKAAGIGVPALLSFAIVFALRRPPLEGALFALAAGFAEDSLSSMPFASCALFFTLAAAFFRWRKLPLAFAVPVYCAFQIWLWMWFGARLRGNVFSRTLVALPIGALTLFAAHVFLAWLDRKAAVDE